MPDIYDAIAQINALLAAGTEAKVGAEHFSEHSGAARRVLWVPGKDTFEPPPNRGHSTRRPVHRCVANWQVFCWGKGDDVADAYASMRATTALRDEVIAAIHEVAQGDYRVTGGAFDAQDGAAILQSGRLYVLQISFSTAVLERDHLALAPISRATVTVNEKRPDGSDGMTETIVAEDL